METEERIQKLEAQVKDLQTNIHETLAEISKSLPEKPARTTNWNRSAWVLALINLLMAVVLLGNAYLFAPLQAAFALSPLALTWLRALWLVIAFVWLLLQLYPLALLLTDAENDWRQVKWSSAFKLMRARPGLLLAVTVLLLLSALINMFMPAAWLLVTLVLLVVIAGLALRSLFDWHYKFS